MKNFTHFRIFLWVASFALVGLFQGCGHSEDDTPVVEPQKVTYTGIDGGITYTLEITETISTRAYAPKGGDTYVLTAASSTSLGSVVNATGGVFTLKPANASESFEATVSGSDLTALAGKVTWSDNSFLEGPGSFSIVYFRIVTQPRDTVVVEGSIRDSLWVEAEAMPISATLRYQWYQSTTKSYEGSWVIQGATSATFPIPTTLTSGAPAQQSTSYYYFCEVSVTDAAPLRSEVVEVIVLIGSPVITVQPENCTVDEGESTSFSVEATGTSPLNYQWYQWDFVNWICLTDEGLYSGATTATLTLSNIPASFFGNQYYCRVTNEAGGVNSDVVVLLVNPKTKPVITVNTYPLEVTVTEGSINGSLSVEASVSQGSGFTFQWHRIYDSAYQSIEGATSSTYSIPSDLTVGVYSYLCWVNGLGLASLADAVWSEVITVNVVSLITLQPAPCTATEGGSASFTVEANNALPLSYQWYGYMHGVDDNWKLLSDNEIYSGAESATLTLTNIPLSYNYYQYSCMVSNPSRSVWSEVATLYVTPASPPVITLQPVSCTAIEGGSATFTLEATADYPLMYKWRVDMGGEQVHWVELLMEGGYSGENTNALTLSNIPMSLDGCYFQCYVSGIVNEGIWTEWVQLTVTPPPPVITLQPVSCTAIEGGSATFTLEATANYPLLYKWHVDIGGQLVWVDLPWVENPIGITNTLTLTDIHLTLDGFYFQCWVYSVANVGIWSDRVQLTVTPLPKPPVITVQPEHCTVDEGGSTSFSVEATGTSPLNYQWFVGYSNWNSVTDGGVYSGATTATLTLSNVPASFYGYQYICEISNEAGEVISNIGKLTVNPKTKPVITVNTYPLEVTVSEGSISGSLSVEASVSQGEGLNFFWYRIDDSGNRVYEGINSTTFPIPTDLTVGTYSYICRVSGVGLASLADVVWSEEITVNVVQTPAPVITITTQPEDITIPEGSVSGSLTVGASVTLGATLRYQWYANASNSLIGGNAIRNATSPNYVLPSTLTEGKYYYYCVVSAPEATQVRSRIATVTVVARNVEVWVGEQVGSIMAGEESKVSFPVFTTGLKDDTYSIEVANLPKGVEAQKSITLSSGNGTLTLLVEQNAAAGVYDNLTLTIEQTTSSLFTLSIDYATVAPTIIAQPEDVAIYSGEDATFAVKATGDPDPTFQWQASIDGGAWTDLRDRREFISGSTTSKLTLMGVVYSANGNRYRCVATNSAGSDTSRYATLTVDVP